MVRYRTGINVYQLFEFDLDVAWNVDLCEAAICAVKQVCLGVKLVTPHEPAELLRCIADAPIAEQFRGELKDLFNQKLSNAPPVSLHRSTLTKVEFPENYLRQVDWAKFMNKQHQIGPHGNTNWLIWGCNIRQRRVRKMTLLYVQCSQSKRL